MINMQKVSICLSLIVDVRCNVLEIRVIFFGVLSLIYD